MKSSYIPETSEALHHCHNYTDWLALISDSSRYFKSYTKIYFLSGTFNLSTQINIDNVTNISINGIDSIKITSIKCSNNAFLFISNATFVQIENFELIACGRNVAQYTKGQEAYTALFLHNVVSVNISNVAFKNSYGHSIIGINLMGSSVLQQVSVFYMNGSNNVNKLQMGGIFLMFSDEITYHIYNMPQNVIIEHCNIYYMENLHRNNEPFCKEKGILRSLAFGFDFNQQKYSANVILTQQSQFFSFINNHITLKLVE